LVTRTGVDVEEVTDLALRRTRTWNPIVVTLVLVDLAILGMLGFTLYQKYGIPWA
jgi:hypothetical protein